MAYRQRKLEELKDCGFTFLISGMIGGLVALPFYLRFGVSVFPGVAHGAFAGAIIGLVSRTGFVMVHRRIGTHPFWAFSFIGLTIGGGTSTIAYLLGLRGVLPFILLILLAEAVGLTVTFVKYRYSRILNQKLQVLQRQIQSENGSPQIK
ncbi:MAG: hypothetical protein JXR76_07685 [Deltaproteobacteria bacterium]|nr:hypothetical protein [Deltaproteobacteria bacterium]